MSDDARFQQTSYAIMEQVGQLPPASVLGAALQFSPVTPDYIAAMVTWGDNYTKWQVVATVDAGLLEVQGCKEVDSWHGGVSRDDRDNEDISANLYPWRTLEHVGFSLSNSYWSADGSRMLLSGDWTLSFGLDRTVQIDTTKVHTKTFMQVDGLLERAMQSLNRA